ncbi:hypothetical protein J1N35_033554 [Gossypium stocksii]|uniref:Retrotransposon gag domain-containing protein n=1 Tax=Gossypium stocksii TaxID=47602 RepID=A0A9D3US96_9ROSI|nr:hypothetical protein J1N35_033554 [Gossypium stocksii]
MWKEFQCELKGQFYPEFAKEEAQAKLQGIKQRGTVGEYNVEQRGVPKLSKAITVVESMVKLGVGKDKLGSSKSEERDVRKENHKEGKDNDNGNSDNGGNRKP